MVVGHIDQIKMIIDINTETIEEFDLTPDEYIYLWSLFNKYTPAFPLNADVDKLHKEKFLKESKLTDKGREVFLDPDWYDKFKEFYEAFPHQVVNPRDGKLRPLRSEGLETQVARDVKRKYRKLHKQHDKIMEGLRAELAMANTGFMHNIIAWLNQQEWEKYVSNDNTPSTSVSSTPFHKNV